MDVNQFFNTIYRYIQLGVHIKAFYSKKYGKFHREIDEVTEFYVDDNNNPVTHTIYRKTLGDNGIMIKPSDHLIEYLENQNINVHPIIDALDVDFPVQSIENIEYDNASDVKEHAEMPSFDGGNANTSNVSNVQLANNVVAQNTNQSVVVETPPVTAVSNSTVGQAVTGGSTSEPTITSVTTEGSVAPTITPVADDSSISRLSE